MFIDSYATGKVDVDDTASFAITDNALGAAALPRVLIEYTTAMQADGMSGADFPAAHAAALPAESAVMGAATRTSSEWNALMRARLCVLVLTLAAGASYASTGADQQSETLQDAAITERSTIPPYTGYIRTWIQFGVKAKEKELVVLLAHFEDGKQIPELGETCQIHYHTEVIEGQVGDRYVQEATANVVDQMKCERR